MDVRETLRRGCEIVEPVLAPHGFRAAIGPTQPSSGGPFARAEFFRGLRRLELSFRHSLGEVAYRLGPTTVPHEAYLDAVGAPQGAAAYPGFSSDPMDGFRHLAADLAAFGGPFLAGTDAELAALLDRAARWEPPRGFGAIG